MKAKLINDPVHGFLNFVEPELLKVIDHPWFQRLRYISQMGVAHLVYPGAVHTRFLHSLGACHLMGRAIEVLHSKHIEINKDEKKAAHLAILLHDIGHGPFSHALEHSLIENCTHEQLSSLITQQLNKELGGILDLVPSIFKGQYPKLFLHQLVSSQLDVDRLDYLSRDSFYSGVSEGVIGYDRIIKMLCVVNGQLAVEEKGIYSVEKFIIARHIMYWQVYLHKTVLGAEQLLVKILKRAKSVAKTNRSLNASTSLSYFLNHNIDFNNSAIQEEALSHFCNLDDSDVLLALKNWQHAEDNVLATLCKMFVQRKLYKVVIEAPNEEELYEQHWNNFRNKHGFTNEEIEYFVFRGHCSNSAYNPIDDKIYIAMKNGDLINLADMPHSLIGSKALGVHRKSYLCYCNF